MSLLYWPLDPSRISYGYGNAPGYGGFHDGIDFDLDQGSELRATTSGTIRNNDAGQVDGAGVDITTPDGWLVRMWHVSKFLVPNGSTVEAGQVIALSGGDVGTWGAGNSTGAHLHWGVFIGGKPVNPESLNPIMFENETKKEKKMLSFIATDPNGAWWVTDGLTKRPLAPGENQLLVDLGVARYSGKPGNVNLISPEQFDQIPTLEV